MAAHITVGGSQRFEATMKTFLFQGEISAVNMTRGAYLFVCIQGPLIMYARYEEQRGHLASVFLRSIFIGSLTGDIH